jgi:hypothetical protein
LKDSAGDGFVNLFEIETGFNQAVPASTPEASSSIQTNVQFKFDAASGAAYRLESSGDISGWKIVESGIPGMGGTVRRLFSVNGTKCSYFRSRGD